LFWKLIDIFVFFYWHVDFLKVFASISTLHHLSLNWSTSFQSSIPTIFRLLSVSSIHLFLDLGLFPCGFHSNVILTISFFFFSHYVTILVTGASAIIYLSTTLYFLFQIPVDSSKIRLDQKIIKFFSIPYYRKFSNFVLSISSSSTLTSTIHESWSYNTNVYFNFCFSRYNYGLLEFRHGVITFWALILRVFICFDQSLLVLTFIPKYIKLLTF